MQDYKKLQSMNYEMDDTDIMEQDSFFEGTDIHDAFGGDGTEEQNDDEMLCAASDEEDNMDEIPDSKRRGRKPAKADVGKVDTGKADAGDDYLSGALPVHKRLPQDPHPSKEKLKRIYDDFHSEDPERVDNAKKDMLGIMSPYILGRINMKYQSYMVHHMEDLMEQGYIGVLKGLPSFDPEKGMPTTWFVRYIDHEIQDYISRQIHNSSAYYAQHTKVINKCIEERKKKGMGYTVRDIMIETNLPHKTIEKVLQTQNAKSVPIDGEASVELVSAYEAPEDAAIRIEAEETVRNLLCKKGLLTREERICIMLRFGINDTDDTVMQKYLEMLRQDNSEEVAALNRANGKTRSFADIEFLAKRLYDMDIPRYLASRLIASATTKLKAEIGHQKRAKICHRIRTDMQSHLTGEMLSKVAMKKDQEAVAEFMATDIYTIS